MRILFLIFFLLSPLAHAKIYVVIDDPSAKKFPIAVPQFVDTQGNTSQASTEISNLLKRDLDLAGYFSIIDESGFAAPDTDTQEIHFEKWLAIDAHALVKGIVEENKGGKLLMEIRLYDTQTREMLVGKQYIVSNKDYATAIHRFMDDLLEAMTGIRGPFNSTIAMACGKSFGRQIYTLGIDGTNMRQITNIKSNSISPSWSPDGSTLVFTSFKSRYPEIYRINSSGGGLTQLTVNGATNITPAFSPTGDSVAYASSVTGDTELYLMSNAGKLLKRLSKVPNIELAPAWSPDGSKIAFSSERAGNLHLFVMNSDGSGANRLTYTGYQNDQPDFSPDGQKIVFTSRDRGAFDVFMMYADGSMIQRITRDEGNNESPTFSPDGRYIAFSSERRGASGLYIMMADGNNQTLIPNTSGCINPDWGPRIK